MTEPSEAPYESPVPGASAEPPRLARPGHLVGRAHSVDRWTEPHPYRRYAMVGVVSFRLLVPGRARAPEVELRGEGLTGVVRDGDWVEVADRAADGRELVVRHLVNLTTTSSMRARSPSRPVGLYVLLGTIAVLIVLLFVLEGLGLLP